MSVIDWFLNAQLTLGGSTVLWREIIGNGFGLASALVALPRKVWAWPIGMVGNVLLFTVFLGAIFDTPQDKDLWGQAGRQVFFFAVSVYGMVRWMRARRAGGSADGGAITPRWATGRERLELLVLAGLGIAIFYPTLTALGSWGPLEDAWILTGSILATYGMARGWVEFWLIWIAVDLVGVPLLFAAGYWPSATMYAVYGVFCAWGFVAWARVQRTLTTRTTPGDQKLVTAA